MKENGRVPHALSVSGSGNGVSWGNHSDSDIIGYRVYKNGAKVATIKAGVTLLSRRKWFVLCYGS